MKVIFGLALLLCTVLVNVNAGSTCKNLLEMLDKVLEKNTKLEKSVNQMNAALTELKEKNGKLEASRCAFAATGDSRQGIIKTSDSPITFPYVHLNTCGGYDAKTGVFTATMAGTYVFHMHVRSEGRDSGSIYMVKNKKRICSTWIDDVKGLWDNAACSAVTELVPGDKVKVTGETSNRGRITGNKMGFSGILIYPA